jgi:hypothetical protein
MGALAYVYFEDERGAERRPSCSPATGPCASPATPRSCRSCQRQGMMGRRRSRDAHAKAAAQPPIRVA